MHILHPNYIDILIMYIHVIPEPNYIDIIIMHRVLIQELWGLHNPLSIYYF